MQKQIENVFNINQLIEINDIKEAVEFGRPSVTEVEKKMFNYFCMQMMPMKKIAKQDSVMHCKEMWLSSSSTTASIVGRVKIHVAVHFRQEGT